MMTTLERPISLRCNGTRKDGKPCNHQLGTASCDFEGQVELKCPKCATVVPFRRERVQTVALN